MPSSPDTLRVLHSGFASMSIPEESMVLTLADLAWSKRFSQPRQNFLNRLLTVLRSTVHLTFCTTNVFGSFCGVMALFELVRHKFPIWTTLWSILPLGFVKERGTRTYKLILYFYSSMGTLVWSWRAAGESSSTRKTCREPEQQVVTDFSQNSWPYIILKLLCDPHVMLVFYWSKLTPTHSLFFISLGLHPCNPCSPVIPLLILSMAGCICQQHPRGSS